MIEPRIHYAPPRVSSLVDEAIDLGETYGVFMDDWQRFSVEVLLGVRADGRWAAFEFGENVGRQNGKNEIALLRQLVGLFLLGPSGFPVTGPKRMRDGEMLLIHSAHEFKTSQEHFRRVEDVIQNNPDLHAKVKGGKRGYKHSHGEEGIEFRSGQRIRFFTRTSGGGRGHTGDVVVLDEAMQLAAAFLGALMPTMSARSIHGNPQLLYFFTAVDRLIQEHGQVAAKLRARAIASLDPNVPYVDPSLAYLEWSARVPKAEKEKREPTPDDVDRELATSVEAWQQANPSLDIRISREHIAAEQRSLPARQFAVERLGVGDYPPVDEDGPRPAFDLDAWDAFEDRASKPRKPVVFAYDITPARTMSAIAVAGYRSDGVPHVEVIEHREGTVWVPERLAELQTKWRPAGVAYGKDSPAESLVADLEKLRIKKLRGFTVAENAAACGRLFDALKPIDEENEEPEEFEELQSGIMLPRGLAHIGELSPHGAALRSAIAGAAQKPHGDKWLLSRSKSNVDISPLCAVTLALYLLSLEVRPRTGPMVAFA